VTGVRTPSRETLSSWASLAANETRNWFAVEPRSILNLAQDAGTVPLMRSEMRLRRSFVCFLVPSTTSLSAWMSRRTVVRSLR
jgi:hypothetical protein